MLGKDNRLTLDIKIEDKIYKIKWNIRTLLNLYELFKITPIEVISEFLKLESIEDKRNSLVNILICAIDDITIEALTELFESDEYIESLYNSLIVLINSEMVNEVREEVESNDDEKELTLTEKNENWLIMYNELYYSAIYQLKMPEEEFYNSTLREIRTLDKLNKNYFKNIQIQSYIDIHTSKNKTDKKELEKLQANANNKLRIKDMLMK